MRTIMAGLVGGIVFFFWGAVAHMLLPIGTMGMKMPGEQQATLTAIAATTHGPGVYVYPSIAPEKWNDEAAVKAFNEANKDSAYAFVVYQPGGNPAHADMTPNLEKQFASDLLSALIVAFVLALGTFGFAKRVFIATALGAFSALTVSVPYWNWYLFPLDFTIGSVMEQVLGWMLAGIFIALVLGRRQR
jgi:hypothetical protein